MALDNEIGGTTSDSYGTLAAYKLKATAYGWTVDADDTVVETLLRRATQILDRQYSWKGVKASSDQALKWPRDAVGYIEGHWVDYTIVPADIINAQYEIANLLQEGDDPLATITSSKTKDKKKVGPIEVEVETIPTSTPRLVVVEGLVGPYISGGVGSVRVARG